MRWIMLCFLAFWACPRISTGANLTMPDMKPLVELARKSASETFKDLRNVGLELRAMLCMAEFRAGQEPTEDTSFSFWRPGSVKRSADGEDTIVKAEAVVISISMRDGRILPNREIHTSRFNREGRLVRSRGEATESSMEAAFSQVQRVEPTALRAMFAEEHRKQILNAARNAVAQKLPAIKNADLELARIHYEWSLSDLDGQTNEIFFVDLRSPAKNPPQQKSDRAATDQEDRIRVALDREGRSMGVRSVR